MIRKQHIALGWVLAAMVVTAAAPGFSQGAVNLTGTVTDLNGAPLRNAKVVLQGRNLTALTDVNGKYALKTDPTGLGREGRDALGAAPAVELKGSGITLRIASLREHVHVSVFDLSGSKVSEALTADLASGVYEVDPFTGDFRAGTYLVLVRIGAKRHALRMQSPGSAAGSIGFHGAAGSTGGILRSGAALQGEAVLRKVAAAPETLSVVAVGYDRGERVVETATGTQDFKLGALKWTNVSYKAPGQPACSRCILDVRKPASGSKWPVLVQFHGGGMTGGDRNEPYGTQYANFGQKLLDNGIMMVTPGYTLAGGATTVWPQYIRDAAQAAVWVRKNIESYGGDPNSVFISGFSAGAYLTHMLSIDTAWLQEARSDVSQFAGFISMSGQTRTHDNIRNDLKVSDIMKEKPYAMPMGKIRKTTQPWQIFVGSLEGGTIDSNKALYDALMAKGSTNLYFDIIAGQGHTTADIAAATSPKRDKLLAFINKHKAQ